MKQLYVERLIHWCTRYFSLSLPSLITKVIEICLMALSKNRITQTCQFFIRGHTYSILLLISCGSIRDQLSKPAVICKSHSKCHSTFKFSPHGNVISVIKNQCHQFPFASTWQMRTWTRLSNIRMYYQTGMYFPYTYYWTACYSLAAVVYLGWACALPKKLSALQSPRSRYSNRAVRNFNKSVTVITKANLRGIVADCSNKLHVFALSKSVLKG